MHAVHPMLTRYFCYLHSLYIAAMYMRYNVMRQTEHSGRLIRSSGRWGGGGLGDDMMRNPPR